MGHNDRVTPPASYYAATSGMASLLVGRARLELATNGLKDASTTNTYFSIRYLRRLPTSSRGLDEPWRAEACLALVQEWLQRRREQIRAGTLRNDEFFLSKSCRHAKRMPNKTKPRRLANERLPRRRNGANIAISTISLPKDEPIVSRTVASPDAAILSRSR